MTSTDNNNSRQKTSQQRSRSNDKKDRNNANNNAGGADGANAGQPLVPPRVDPVEAMKRFNPFCFQIDTDTKETTDLRAAFAALQRDAFVSPNLFILDRAEVCTWFAGLTDPTLAAQIAEVKSHLQTLVNFDAYSFQALPADGANAKAKKTTTKAADDSGELNVHDAGNLIALAYKCKILQQASEREMRLIKEEDERIEAFDAAVERFMEEGLSREAAVAEAQKEEDAARSEEEKLMAGGTGGGGGNAAQSGGSPGAASGEEDVPGADGRNPTFVLMRGFPQCPENVVQLARHGIQLHSSFAINSLARLGKRDDPVAAAMLVAGGGGGKSALGASTVGGAGASSKSGNKSDIGSPNSAAASTIGGKAGAAGAGGGAGAAGGKKSAPALGGSEQKAPILSLSSAVKKEVLRVHPFRDHPLRHVHCWTYNVATAEGTRIVDEATGQKERILQESENDVADRVVSEVITVEACLNRYRQWIATKTVPTPEEQDRLTKANAPWNAATAAAVLTANSSLNNNNNPSEMGSPEASLMKHTESTAHEPTPENSMRKASVAGGPKDAKEAQNAAMSVANSLANAIAARANQIATDVPLHQLTVPRLVDVTAELQAKAAEEERQRIIELHKAHEATVLANAKGNKAGASAKKLTGRQQKELADTTGLPEVPPAPLPPAPLSTNPTQIPHDSSLLRHILDSAPSVTASTLPEVILAATFAQAAASACTSTEIERNGLAAIQQHNSPIFQHNNNNNNTGAAGMLNITVSAPSPDPPSNNNNKTAVSSPPSSHNLHNTSHTTSAANLESTQTSNNNINNNSTLFGPAGKSSTSHSVADQQISITAQQQQLHRLQNAGVNLHSLESKTSSEIRDVLDFCDFMFASMEGKEDEALNEIRKRRLAQNSEYGLVTSSSSLENQQQQQQNLPSDNIFTLVSEFDSSRGGSLSSSKSQPLLLNNNTETVESLIRKYNNAKYLLQPFLKSLSVPFTDVKSMADLTKTIASILTERCGFSLEDAQATIARRGLARVWNADEAVARLAQVTQNPDMSIRICSGLTTATNPESGGCVAVVAPGSFEPTAFVPIQERKRFRVCAALFTGTVSFPEWMARRAYIEKEELFFNPPPSEDDDEMLLGGAGDDDDDDEDDEMMFDDDLDENNGGAGADTLDENGQPIERRRRKKQKVKPPPEYILFERNQTKELRRRAALELIRASLQPGVSGAPDKPSQALAANNHSAYGIYGESTLMTTRDPFTTVRTLTSIGGSRCVDSFVQSGPDTDSRYTVTVSFHATLPPTQEDAMMIPRTPEEIEKEKQAALLALQQQQQQSQQQQPQSQNQPTSGGRKSTFTPNAQQRPVSSQAQINAAAAGKSTTTNNNNNNNNNNNAEEQQTTPRQVMFKVAPSHHDLTNGEGDNGGGTPRGDLTGRSTGSGSNDNPYYHHAQGRVRRASFVTNTALPSLPVTVRVQANFGDEALLSALSQKKGWNNNDDTPLQYSQFLSFNKSDDVVQFFPSEQQHQNDENSSSLSMSENTSRPATLEKPAYIEVTRNSARRWTRLPIFNTATGETSFVDSREVSRIISASDASVKVTYHNGYVATLFSNGSVSISSDNNNNNQIITTQSGHRILLLLRSSNPTSLLQQALVTRITNTELLPFGVISRDVREDGVVITRLKDGRILVEHNDGTQFWTNKKTGIITVENWPAQPVNPNDAVSQRDTFRDPSHFVSNGPFASPIQVNVATKSLSFLAVRSGDLFVDFDGALINTEWRPTGQTFVVDCGTSPVTGTHLAYFQAVLGSSSDKKENGNGVRFVFDIAHGGLRGVDSLPDQCPDGPSGLADAISLHVTPFGRTRIRKLIEDSAPVIDTDVTRPRQIIEQFAIESEQLHPLGTILPENREGLHMMQGPPPSLSPSSNKKLNSSSSSSLVVSQYEGNFLDQDKIKVWKQQVEKCFSVSNNNKQKESSSSKRPHPVDPAIFYLLPDGRLVELMRPQESSRLTNEILHESDGVFSTLTHDNILCSIPSLTPSAIFAAMNASLLRHHLSTSEPSTCRIGRDQNQQSRLENGPAKNVSEFLQRVHTYGTQSAHSHGNVVFNNINNNNIEVENNLPIIVKTQLVTSVSSVVPEVLYQSAPSSSLADRNFMIQEQYRDALEVLHKAAAPPLAWLQKGINNYTQLINASHFPSETAQTIASVHHTASKFPDPVVVKRAELEATLADAATSKYFNANTKEGAEIIAQTKSELLKGEWKALVREGQEIDHGTRGSGNAHFAAAAAKLLEVGHGGMLSSPRHRERQNNNNNNNSNSTAKTSALNNNNNAISKSSQQQQQQNSPGSGSPMKRPAPPPLRRIEQTAVAQSILGNSLSGPAGSVSSLAASVRGHIHARLLLEPSQLEFAPLHRGLRYQTSINLINVGSNASRYRVKVSHLQKNEHHQHQQQVMINNKTSSSSNRNEEDEHSHDDEEIHNNNINKRDVVAEEEIVSSSNLPSWIKADIPQVRLGPGMRAQIILEINGHQPAGEEYIDITVTFEGPHQNTMTANAIIHIVTIDAKNNTNNNNNINASSVSNSSGVNTSTGSGNILLQHNHQQSLCWVTTSGNTVECLGASTAQFVPASVKRMRNIVAERIEEREEKKKNRSSGVVAKSSNNKKKATKDLYHAEDSDSESD